MDFLFLEKLSDEFNRLLKGKRINEIYCNGSAVSLSVGEQFLNFFFGNPNALFVSGRRIAEKPLNTLSFIKGSYVKGFYLPKKDRVLFAEVVKLLPSGKGRRFFLVFEVTGKNANFLIIDGENKILFVSREVQTTVREVRKGAVYEYPPCDKLPFSELKFGKITKEGIEKKLYKFVEGISPLNSKEIAYLYSKVGSLAQAYENFMGLHESSKDAFLYFENGTPKYLTTFKYSSLSGLDFKVFSGERPFSSAWEEYYVQNVELKRKEVLKQKLLDRLERKIETLKKELKELSDVESLEAEAEKYRKWGELLKYNLHLVKPGSKEITVYDYEENKEVKIPLDPSLSPKHNLERIFKAYKKFLKRAEFSKTRLSELTFKIEELERLKRTLEETENLEEPFVEERKGNTESSPYLTFVLPSGRKILVGKNGKANELITLKLSNPWDLWFHVKNLAGSHVVLKLNRGEKPSEEDIELAASAAAFFSKGKHSGKLLVDYTEIKNVKKPKNSPVGKVIYRNEKTIRTDPHTFEKFLKNGAP